MLRVAGTDPGTSSLDMVLLEDGRVVDQVRFAPEDLQADPAGPVAWLKQRGPLNLVAGPSGYGLPLVRGEDCTEGDLQLMSLVRPKERGQDQGVAKFLAVVRAFLKASLPVIFLPGVIHLPTVPIQRKINRIDLGTADKLSVAALALGQSVTQNDFCLVELGSAFTACVVVQDGKIVDGVGGTSGPIGWGSSGVWDGEMAYLLSPLSKRDLFQGGLGDLQEGNLRLNLACESLRKCLAGLQTVTPFREIVLSGRLLEREPQLVDQLQQDLAGLSSVRLLDNLSGAWVKHAAQGAALLADGLAGGTWSGLVEQLQLRQARGSVLDWLCHPRGRELRARFLG